METTKIKDLNVNDFFKALFGVIVLGILVGGHLLKWLFGFEAKFDSPEAKEILTPLFWFGAVVFIVGGTIIEMRKQKRQNKIWEERNSQNAKKDKA